ncbi:MAG TPA: DUF2807 domain-containing protein [Rhizomicrobium sp.]|jgi:hypothetical protein|nr:DUF2807 domain-containing protein [Rhizomicrobium sp.]
MMRASLLLSAVLLTAGPALADQSVAVGPFRVVALAGGGHVEVKPGATQSVILTKGSTEFTTIRVESNGTLDIEACNGRCPEHYDLDVVITTPNITGVSIKGGGDIHVAPGFKLGEFDAAVTGGGRIDARDVPAQRVNAAVTGGGRIAVTANSALNAAVEGGGSIAYWGKPTVNQAVDGGGSIKAGE